MSTTLTLTLAKRRDSLLLEFSGFRIERMKTTNLDWAIDAVALFSHSWVEGKRTSTASSG